jgi:hypothetical protein
MSKFWDSLTNYLAVSGFWAGVSKYGKHHDETRSVYGNWFKNSLQINIPYLIFMGSDPVDVELMTSSRNETNLPTYFVIKEKSDFKTTKDYPTLSHISAIWNEKINLVLEAHKLFPYIDWLVWIDAGVNTFRDQMPPPVSWPQLNLSATYKPSLLFTQRKEPHDNMICGNTFVVHKDVLIEIHSLFYEVLDNCMKTRKQSDCEDDQYHFLKASQKKPHLFTNLSPICKQKHKKDAAVDCTGWGLLLLHQYNLTSDSRTEPYVWVD